MKRLVFAILFILSISYAQDIVGQLQKEGFYVENLTFENGYYKVYGYTLTKSGLATVKTYEVRYYDTQLNRITKKEEKNYSYVLGIPGVIFYTLFKVIGWI
ncbi:hypothetical protein DRN75_02985 [Nanoarchaeota archaeon]|nr:MAG: hypothetical protein DRN75_02985 [Nanoarchaeota archaeon]